VTSAWWFLAAVVGIVALGVVLERYERRVKEAERRRRHEHGRYMVEVRRQPPSSGPRRHGGQP
jgi:hypothetical protein